ncbi:MAG: type II CAAX prenyl endopeptidase Rce1 family protein [Terriglobales bacterium]
MESTDPTLQVAAVGPPDAPAPGANTRVAPIWHTVLLIVVLLAFSFAGASSQSRFTAGHGRAILYGSTVVWEWLLVGFVYVGIRKRTKLRDLIGGRWASVEDALLDIGLGVGLYVVLIAVIAGFAFSMGMMNEQTVSETREKLGFIVPRNGFELVLFFLLSATAGFCEEVIFRGYFQRQFAALTNYVAAGIALQALLFGAVHGYQGGKRMVIIAAEGVLFGVFAYWRRSLRPGMVAHFSQDALAGAVALAHKLAR